VLSAPTLHVTINPFGRRSKLVSVPSNGLTDMTLGHRTPGESCGDGNNYSSRKDDGHHFENGIGLTTLLLWAKVPIQGANCCTSPALGARGHGVTCWGAESRGGFGDSS
jgi:hypothetical protein